MKAYIPTQKDNADLEAYPMIVSHKEETVWLKEIDLPDEEEIVDALSEWWVDEDYQEDEYGEIHKIEFGLLVADDIHEVAKKILSLLTNKK